MVFAARKGIKSSKKIGISPLGYHFPCWVTYVEDCFICRYESDENERQSNIKLS